MRFQVSQYFVSIKKGKAMQTIASKIFLFEKIILEFKLNFKKKNRFFNLQ
jgi:hypothetical protein